MCVFLILLVWRLISCGLPIPQDGGSDPVSTLEEKQGEESAEPEDCAESVEDGVHAFAIASALRFEAPCARNAMITERLAREHSWQVAQVISSRCWAGHTIAFRPAGVSIVAGAFSGTTATTGPASRSASLSAWDKLLAERLIVNPD